MGFAYLSTSNLFLSAVFATLTLITAFAFRAYESEALESVNEQLVRLLVSVFFATVILLAYRALNSVEIEAVKLVQAGLLTYFTTPFLNVLLYHLFKVRFMRPKRYLVIGRREEIGKVLDEITERSRGKYQFVDFVNPSPTTVKEKLKRHDHVLVANFELYKRVEYLLIDRGRKVEYLSDLAEKVLKRIPLEVVDKFKEYYEIEFSKAKESPAKRILDVIGGIAGLIVFSPLILLSAVFILIEDGWPVVFKQLRVGKDNREFMLYKLRSMRNVSDGKAKFANDEKDRILKIGRIIRPTRIDESLQFWNILKGDMSIVGPRPEQVPFVRQFEQQLPYYSYRHRLKPGLTGWAQIMYQYSATLEEVKKKLEYDLYYIKNRTTLLDLRIILQTIEAVFWRRGAR